MDQLTCTKKLKSLEQSNDKNIIAIHVANLLSHTLVHFS